MKAATFAAWMAVAAIGGFQSSRYSLPAQSLRTPDDVAERKAKQAAKLARRAAKANHATTEASP